MRVCVLYWHWRVRNRIQTSLQGTLSTSLSPTGHPTTRAPLFSMALCEVGGCISLPAGVSRSCCYCCRGAGACKTPNLGPSCGAFDPKAPPLAPNRSTYGPGGAQNDRKSQTLDPIPRYIFLGPSCNSELDSKSNRNLWCVDGM
jgi:hypothetical protein